MNAIRTIDIIPYVTNLRGIAKYYKKIRTKNKHTLQLYFGMIYVMTA